MAIIDKRGMIFGKVNVIDFLVVIFILSLTPMFYFGWKLYTKKLPSPPTPPININWEQKYKEEIAQKEVIFKKHPRLKKYFK